jgi:hypothetical protein
MNRFQRVERYIPLHHKVFHFFLIFNHFWIHQKNAFNYLTV